MYLVMSCHSAALNFKFIFKISFCIIKLLQNFKINAYWKWRLFLCLAILDFFIFSNYSSISPVCFMLFISFFISLTLNISTYFKF